MAEVAKNSDFSRQDLTTAQISALAESSPSVPAIIGWLANASDLYVYLTRSDGTPTLHAGREREGEPHLAAIPGEEFSICVIGEIASDVLSQISLILSTAMARQRADMMVEAKNHSDLFRSLVAGDPEALERARNLGWDVDREVFLIVGRMDEMAIPEIADEWKRIIRNRDPKALVIYFPTEIVAVVARETLPPKEFAEVLPRGGAIGGNGVVGVSKTGLAATSIGALYQEADTTLNVVRSIGRHDGVWSLDDLGSYQLLVLINDTDALRNFLTHSLKELGIRTDLEAVDLRRTLQTLLDNNLNIAETARALHFHYNTLRYRISKLEKMLGNFTADPELRLALALALRLFNLHARSRE